MSCPTQVTVVRPTGEVVAELLASPTKPILRLKTQLAGLEGVAVSNQALLLDGQPIDDASTLASLGVEEACHLVLVRRAPLLGGRLTTADLCLLLRDQTALDEAIDAYSDNLQYSDAEVEEILAAVSAALLPSSRCPSHPSAEAGVRGTPSGLDIEARGLSSKRAAFRDALRLKLQMVQSELEGPKFSSIDESPALAEDHEVACGAVPRQSTETGDTEAFRCALKAAPPLTGKAKEARPWGGAGAELESHLKLRWASVEGPV